MWSNRLELTCCEVFSTAGADRSTDSPLTMEQVAKSGFRQSTRSYVHSSRRPGTGIHAARLPLQKQHRASERQRLSPALYQVASSHRSLLNRTGYKPSAVQQQEAATTDLSSTKSAGDDFLLEQSQLQQLAQKKDSPLFESASVANVFQLANALRTSLDFGLVTDTEDLERRAAVFGCNTLPSKEEVNPTQ